MPMEWEEAEVEDAVSDPHDEAQLRQLPDASLHLEKERAYRQLKSADEAAQLDAWRIEDAKTRIARIDAEIERRTKERHQH
jgi:hypothetical protein